METPTASGTRLFQRAKTAFEWALNILTLCVAATLVAVFVRPYFFPAPPAAASVSEIPVGSRIGIDDIEWRNLGSTLLFVLQVGCRYCEASAPFYADLLKANSTGSFRAVAIFPQPVEAATEYAKTHNLHFPDIRQRDLQSLKVTGTPTLILVGPDGRVEAAWRGKLGERQEADVFHRLNLKRPALAAIRPTSNEIAPGPQTVDTFSLSSSTPIVDVRPREAFRLKHIDQSFNIPMDELEARAIHEVRPTEPLVVYCDQYAPCEVQSSERLSGYCKAAEHLLSELGYKHLRFLTGDPDAVASRFRVQIASPLSASAK